MLGKPSFRPACSDLVEYQPYFASSTQVFCFMQPKKMEDIANETLKWVNFFLSVGIDNCVVAMAWTLTNMLENPQKKDRGLNALSHCYRTK